MTCFQTSLQSGLRICLRFCTPFERLVVVWSARPVLLFVTPGATAHQASQSFPISWSSLKLMFIESVMPSSR